MSHFAYDDKGHLNLKFWANLQPHYLDGHVSTPEFIIQNIFYWLVFYTQPLEVSQAVLTQYIFENKVEKSG